MIDTMTNKERYAEFCRLHPEMPVMMQPWWLEAVCAGKEWDVMLFTAEDLDVTGMDSEHVIAVMPYLLRKRLGMRFVVMPQLTMFGGAWLDSCVQADPKAQERMAKLLTKRLRSMKLAYYYQQFAVGNPMPHWMEKRRFTIEQRVTYRLDVVGAGSPDDDFSKNKQRQLHKAEELLADNEMSAEEFYRFHAACLRERGREVTYSREFLLVLERKSRRAEASAFIRIKEPATAEQAERTVAAAFVVWDRHSLYYLIPAYLPSAAKSGASARLAYEAMLMARQKNLLFDFEGGNDDEGVANHYKQLGGQPAAYYSVSKMYNPLFAALLKLNKWREQKKFRG